MPFESLNGRQLLFQILGLLQQLRLLLAPFILPLSLDTAESSGMRQLRSDGIALLPQSARTLLGLEPFIEELNDLEGIIALGFVVALEAILVVEFGILPDVFNVDGGSRSD